MMNAVFRIASEELRLWYRSRLAVAGLVTYLLLLAGTSVLTVARTTAEKHRRLHHQTEAEERFAAQPDRHPHRMVHYGHYVFRPPTPLAILDPGVDAVTGESIFLEGHRRNTATFANAAASADVGDLGPLTPALLYLTLVPLLLIAFGHGLILRERETRTLPVLLALGLSTRTLVWGKALVLLSLIGVLLLPAALVVTLALWSGEPALTGVSLLLSYGAYLLIWGGTVLLASLVCRDRGLALGVLLAIWLAWTLIVPRFGVAVTIARLPTRGQLELDLQMQAEVDKAGDGHDPTDPAFAQLRTNLLGEYEVDRVEDLPINIRGVVAEAAEAASTEISNRYANARMAREAEQARGVAAFGWLSPTVAVGAASRTLAGTDLATHHRFLREAEALRFEFVQRLNRIHATQLAYRDDIDRSRDARAERRTRVSAANWSLLEAFRFAPDRPAERISSALASWLMLAVWAGAIAAACVLATRKLTP